MLAVVGTFHATLGYVWINQQRRTRMVTMVGKEGSIEKLVKDPLYLEHDAMRGLSGLAATSSPL